MAKIGVPRSIAFMTRLLALGFAMAAVVGAQTAPTVNASTGLRFVSGPPGGSEQAMSAARNIRNPGPVAGFRARPLAVYSLDSDALASGKSIQASAVACGFQYVIDTNDGLNSPDRLFRYLGTAEVDLDPSCTSIRAIIGKLSFGAETKMQLDVLATNELVNAKLYEPRVIYENELKAAQFAKPTILRPHRVVAIWLKSLSGGDDLVYPLVDTSSRTDAKILVTASEFVRRIRPALDNVQWSSDQEMHEYFVDRFLESPGNGTSRLFEEPMSVLETMRLRITSSSASGKSKEPSVAGFRLERIDLVGIAKHASPVVFVSRRHRNSRASVDTRPVTAFEKQALTALAAGKPAYVQSDSSGRTVIGALRAQQDCLQCHAGYKVGDMLGALAYRLTPDGATQATGIR